MRLTGKQREFGMRKMLLAIAGALPGVALAAMASAHGGWLPMLGTFALGGLFGSLFGGSGFGAAFVLMLLVVGAVVVLRVLGKPRPEAAGYESPTAARPGSPQAPAGFDVAGFLRAAKLNFVSLQVANDLGRPAEIRRFTTSEMYDALSAEHGGRGGPRPADVVALNADLLKVVTEGDRQLADVRFSGMPRGAPGAAPAGFAEVWSLCRPLDGTSGWLLADIRKVH